MTSTELAVVTEAPAPVRFIDAVERHLPGPLAAPLRPSNRPATLLALLAFVELAGAGYAAMHLQWALSLIGAALFLATACVAAAKLH
jgi:hypothetical protein